MDRALRLSEFWNWLPAFRAVAETEHLPTAASRVGSTPSALSRAVTQLEDAVGCKLFGRAGRRLELQPAGQELLAAVRDAMRRIDDGLDRIDGRAPATVKIAGDGAWLAELIPDAPTVDLEHVDRDPTHVREELHRGAIDIAITEHALDSEGLLIERLGTVAQAVYVASARTRDQFAQCSSRDEAWPVELPRAIAFRSARLGAVVDACRAGHYRAVLPCAVAEGHRLQPLPTPRIASTSLFMLRRRPLTGSPIEATARGIAQRARTVLAEEVRPRKLNTRSRA